MDDHTIRTTAEITVTPKVREAFLEHLRNEIAGYFDRNDIKYTQAILDDAEKHFPERWQADTKQEFICFLAACAEVYAENQQEYQRTGRHAD